MSPQVKHSIPAGCYFPQDLLGREASKQLVRPIDLGLPYFQPESYARGVVSHASISCQPLMGVEPIPNIRDGILVKRLVQTIYLDWSPMVPDLTCCCALQPYYLCGEGAAVFHWSVNTTGAQLYPLPSLCRRPRAGKFICGPAINTSSRASRVSNWCRVAAAALWSMSNTAVTSGRCSWTRSAWTMSPQNRTFCPFDENS